MLKKVAVAIPTWIAIFPFFVINKLFPTFGQQLIYSLYKGIRQKQDFILQITEFQSKKSKVKKQLVAVETAHGEIIYSMHDNKVINQ